MNTMEGVFFGNFGDDLQRILERDCKAVELYWQKEATPTPTHLQNGYVSSEEELLVEATSSLTLQEEPHIVPEQSSVEYSGAPDTGSDGSPDEQQHGLCFQQPSDEGIQLIDNTHHDSEPSATSALVVTEPALDETEMKPSQPEMMTVVATPAEEPVQPAVGTTSSGWSLNVDAPEWQPSNTFCMTPQQQQQQQQQQHMFQANHWMGPNLYQVQHAHWQQGQHQNWQNVTQANFAPQQFVGTHAYGMHTNMHHPGCVQTGINQHAAYGQQGTAMHPASYQSVRHMIAEADFTQPPPGWGSQPANAPHWHNTQTVPVTSHTHSNSNFSTSHVYPPQHTRDTDSYTPNIPTNKTYERRNKKKRNFPSDAVMSESYAQPQMSSSVVASSVGPSNPPENAGAYGLNSNLSNTYNNVDHQQDNSIMPVAVPIVNHVTDVKPTAAVTHSHNTAAFSQSPTSSMVVEPDTHSSSLPVISDVQPDCTLPMEPVKQDCVSTQPLPVAQLDDGVSGVSSVKQATPCQRPPSEECPPKQMVRSADRKNKLRGQTVSPAKDILSESPSANIPSQTQAMPSKTPVSPDNNTSTSNRSSFAIQSQTQSQSPPTNVMTSPSSVTPSHLEPLPPPTLDNNANNKASLSSEICDLHDQISKVHSAWQKIKEPSSSSKNVTQSSKVEKCPPGEDERTKGSAVSVGVTPMDSQINKTKAHLQGKPKENQVPKLPDSHMRQPVEPEQVANASSSSEWSAKPENAISPPVLSDSDFPPMSSNHDMDFPPIVSDKDDEFPPIGSGKVKPKPAASVYSASLSHVKRSSKPSARAPQVPVDNDTEYPAMPSKQHPPQRGKESSSGAASKPKSGGWAALFKDDNEQSSKGTIVYIDKPYKPEDDADYVPQPPPVPSAEDAAAKHLGYLLHEYAMNNQAVSLQPRGLINRGNWCYINATLQALLACPPFYNLFKSLPTFHDSQRGPTSTPIIDSMVEFVNQFSLYAPKPVEKVGKNKEKSSLDLFAAPAFEPKNVYKMLSVINSESAFKHGRQEDAEEFLSCVLNGLHDEMVASINFATKDEQGGKVNGEATKEIEVEEEVEEDEDQWEQVGPKNKSIITRSATLTMSPVSHIFGGQMRSILHQQGSKESATLQPFFTLQLDIQHENISNLRDCLEQLVSKEALQGFTCTKTKQEVEASRRITLESLPPVLILHLKCFVYDKSGGIQKVIKKIELTDKLDISKDLLSGNVKNKLQATQRQYKLFAVVNHHGLRAVGGHYTADIYHPGINSWLHCDDSNIRQVSLQRVLQFQQPKVPYLIYFRRADLG